MGAGVACAGADTHDLLEVDHTNLAVADLARPSRSANGLDHPLSEGIGDRDFDLGFRHELDDVLGAPIDLGVAALPPKASALSNRYARDAQIADGLANLIGLVSSDTLRDQFHAPHPHPQPRRVR